MPAFRRKGHSGHERHELDVISLMTGLVFTVLGVGWLLSEGTRLAFDAAWVVPLLLVGLGLVGLLGTVSGQRGEKGRMGDEGPEG